MSTRKAVPACEKAVLNVRDVAAALGVQPGRVYQMIQSGELPSIRVGSKSGGVRIPRAAFEEYLHGLNQAARASCLVSEFTEAFKQSGGASVMDLITPSAETLAHQKVREDGFFMGLRNMALPR